MTPDIIEEKKNETNAKIYEYLDHFREREVTEIPLLGLFKIVEEALTTIYQRGREDEREKIIKGLEHYQHESGETSIGLFHLLTTLKS